MPQNSPNYYDYQFAQRINQIAKPGATPPSSGNGGSSGGGWGLKGMGGIFGVVVFIVIRALFSAHSSSTYSPPTYQYTPPPTFTVPNQRFELPPDRFQEKGWDDAKDKPLRNEWKEPDIKDNK
jgi:hypothetical protein